MLRTILLLCSASLVMACETTTTAGSGPSGSRFEAFPEYLYQTVFESQTAELLTEGCPTLTYDRGTQSERFDASFKRMIGEGYSESRLRSLVRNVPEERLLQDQIEYFKKNAVTRERASSYCNAGLREIASNSGIGAYLIERRVQ